MLNIRIARTVLAAGALAAASFAVYGKDDDTLRAESRLVNRYTVFAGSQQNAISLVTGLRNGTLVTLQPGSAGCAPPPPPPVGAPPPPGGLLALPPPPPTSLPAEFTPPTRNMGYGNVNIAIDLGKQQLEKAGITLPTPTQLKATFMGGTVSTCAGVTAVLQGVLVLRAGKLGWGRIASQLGLRGPEKDDDD